MKGFRFVWPFNTPGSRCMVGEGLSREAPCRHLIMKTNVQPCVKRTAQVGLECCRAPGSSCSSQRHFHGQVSGRDTWGHAQAVAVTGTGCTCAQHCHEVTKAMRWLQGLDCPGTSPHVSAVLAPYPSPGPKESLVFFPNIACVGAVSRVPHRHSTTRVPPLCTTGLP